MKVIWVPNGFPMGSQWVPNGSHTIRSSDRSPASRMRSQNKVRAECIAAMATGHKTAFAPQRFNKISLRSILCGHFGRKDVHITSCTVNVEQERLASLALG